MFKGVKISKNYIINIKSENDHCNLTKNILQNNL